MTTKAPFTVFLDRDGVFDVHRIPGVLRWHDFEWLPGVRQAFAKLNRPDVQTCLVTNQPMVGHLMATPGMVRHVNAMMRNELEAAGGRMDRMEAAYSPVCFPHRRRKPRPGMLEDGAKWLAQHLAPVDKSRAVMIGDTTKDIQAAEAFGIPGIQLTTTHDEEYLRAKAADKGVNPVAYLPGLPEAVEWILARL